VTPLAGTAWPNPQAALETRALADFPLQEGEVIALNGVLYQSISDADSSHLTLVPRNASNPIAAQGISSPSVDITSMGNTKPHHITPTGENPSPTIGLQDMTPALLTPGADL
jgi:hypothetical protein